jgi:chromosome segregation ATPase
MAESEQHLIDSEARNNALHTQLQQQSDVAGAAIEDATARAAALQAHMVDKTKKMRAVISKTKVEGQQRLYASEAKHQEILGRLAEERTTLASELDQAKARCAELEACLEHHQRSMTDMLDRASARNDQNLQACDAKARELQSQMVQQKKSATAELDKAYERIAELEMKLAHQQRMVQGEIARLQEENERNKKLHDERCMVRVAKQIDEANEQCEARVKKLKARVQDLEMMLDVSKECLKVDPHRILDTDAEASIISIRHSPTKTAGPGTSQDWSGSTNLGLKSGMQVSKSASSLHSDHSGSGSSVTRRTNAFVVKNVGFSWQGRHLGPDQEGPIGVKYDDDSLADDGRVR